MKGFDRVFQGAIFTVGMRWTDRFISFISMIILARLLVPEDFGVVAMASIVVGLFDVLLNLGVAQALIHKDNPLKSDYDTAWTIRLIQAVLASSLILAFAPFAVDYFENAQIADVCRVMALGLLIGGLENIGIVNFQKEMRFDRDFKFRFYKRILSFLVTIGLAIALQSYWAMVLGSLTSRVAGVLLSYIMHPLRPRLSLERFSAIWSFSQWILVKNIGAFLDQKLDQVLVGRKLDADALGGYTLATDITSMPATELLAPLGRVLFPAFVETRNNAMAFASRISTAVGVQCTLVLPACLGLMFVADDAVNVVLGDKWLFVIPLVQILALGNFIRTFSHSTHHVLLALGKVKLLTLVVWLQTIAFLIAGILLWENATAERFATLRLFAILLGSLLMIGILLFHLRAITISAFFGALIRPLFASLFMLLSLGLLHDALLNLLPFARLSFEVATGGIVYLLTISLLWVLAGKPAGAERYFLDNLKRRK